MEETNEKFEKPVDQEVESFLEGEDVKKEETPKTETPVENSAKTPAPEERPPEGSIPEPESDESEPKMVEPKTETTVEVMELGELSDEEKLDVKLKEEDQDIKGEGDDKKTYSKQAYEIIAVDKQEDSLKRRMEQGEQMQPFNKDKPDSVGYQTKLRIRYKDSNYVSLIPNIRWYPQVSNGKKMLSPWFNAAIKEDQLKDPMISTISKLYFKYCKLVGAEPGKVTQKEFINGLVGKKVILKQWETMYQGKRSYRLDIFKFVQ